MATPQMRLAHLHLISGKTDGWLDNYQERLPVINTYTNHSAHFNDRFAAPLEMQRADSHLKTLIGSGNSF